MDKNLTKLVQFLKLLCPICNELLHRFATNISLLHLQTNFIWQQKADEAVWKRKKSLQTNFVKMAIFLTKMEKKIDKNGNQILIKF
jgi:hypothetical protein